MQHDTDHSHADTVPSKTEQVIAQGVKHANLITTPGAGAHMAGYFLHPGVDFFHRITALFFSLVIVAGIYSMFDRPFGSAVFARASHVPESLVSAVGVTFGAQPDCASSVDRFAAATKHIMTDIFVTINAAMPSGIEHESQTQRPCSR